MCKAYKIAAVVATPTKNSENFKLWFGIVQGPKGGYQFLDKQNLMRLYEHETGRTDILKYASSHLILALSAKASIIMQPIDCTEALHVYREHYLPSRNLRCHELLTGFAGRYQRPYFTSKMCVIRDKSPAVLESMYGRCLIA